MAGTDAEKALRSKRKLGGYIKDFLDYMINERRCSPQTMTSYEDMFTILLEFYDAELGLKPEKILLEDLTRERARMFYKWLLEGRGNSPSTKNQRQAALNSFCRYMLIEVPSMMGEYQKILDINRAKVVESDPVYLSKEGMKAFLNAIPRSGVTGRRDHAMFSLAFSTAVRVSELVRLNVENVHFDDQARIHVVGKGGKGRAIPLSKTMVATLRGYMDEKGMLDSSRTGSPLFPSTHGGGHLTRQAVNSLARKYSEIVRRTSPELIPDGFSPHSMRHSLAMALLDDDVELIYIRDLLGHSSVTTTERYARASVKKKDKAINSVVKDILPEAHGAWKNNKRLREMLKNL